MQIISTPLFARASIRSCVFAPTPTAAAETKRPFESFVACGKASAFSISLIVIKPFNFPSLSTTGNFSILFFCKIFLA